jgi:hypothetical protein
MRTVMKKKSAETKKPSKKASVKKSKPTKNQTIKFGSKTGNESKKTEGKDTRTKGVVVPGVAKANREAEFKEPKQSKQNKLGHGLDFINPAGPKGHIFQP